jgi:hypothetical protein
LESTLNELATLKSAAQKQPQEQNPIDICRNYLVIQTLRMEIAFVLVKTDLVAYDEEQLLKHAGKNASAVGGNSTVIYANPGASGENSDVSSVNPGASYDNSVVSSVNPGVDVHH